MTAPTTSTAAPARPGRGADVVVLPPATWRRLEDEHAARADAATAGHRARRAAGGERHAVEDFLYEYYATRPAALRRWHPGVGVALAPATGPAGPAAQGGWRWYAAAPDGTVALDVPAFLADRGEGVRFVARLLTATAGRPAFTGCFGMHEWAMVYRGGTRHPLPLRLGAAGTDAVVEGHRLRCTHADAFRFFTPEAVPRNEHRPTRERQVALEQPGCLHAGMDLYKWALKLGPAVPGALLLDAFDLAREVRVLDMQASPYDVSSYGLPAVAVETPEGKAEYVRRQRGFAVRGDDLRRRLLDVCDALVGPADGAATA